MCLTSQRSSERFLSEGTTKLLGLWICLLGYKGEKAQCHNKSSGKVAKLLLPHNKERLDGSAVPIDIIIIG